MNMICKLSDEQIHEIAETIDASDDICFINRNSGEVVFMMSNEILFQHGISWDDEEDEEEGQTEGPDDRWPEWQKELYNGVKADMAKIYSWDFEETIRIKKPESHETFGFMERFVDEVIPEGELKQSFWGALSQSHPFRNFNAIIHNCTYREDWFEFKQRALEEYVRGEID